MADTLILASSRVRPYAFRAALDFANWAADAQVHGGFVAAPWPQTALPEVATSLFNQGLAMSAVQLPLAPEPLSQGRRVPYWGSLDDPEERLSAIRMSDDTLSRAQTFGCQWAFLDAFPIKLKAPASLFVQCFAENRWERDRSSKVAAKPLLEAALTERKGLDERLCDAARFTLQRLARVGETRGIKIAVGHGFGPWQFPSPKEVDHLLEEFRGAPLFQAHLPARLDILETMGLLTPDRRAALTLSPFVVATEAIGLRDDLAPGLGPKPLPGPLRQAHDQPPSVVVVSGCEDTNRTELVAAVARVTALSSRKPVSKGGS